MIRENVLDHLDYLLDRLAGFTAVNVRMPEITEAAHEAIALARSDSPELQSIFQIASRGRRRSVDVMTHASWILMHAAPSRVHCVRYPLIKASKVYNRSKRSRKPKDYSSPVVDQCKRLGLAPDPIDYRPFYRTLTQTDCTQSIGALYVDDTTHTLNVVAIASTSQCRRFNSGMGSNPRRIGETLPLFEEPTRPWRGVNVASSMLRTVLVARDMLQQAMPALRVRAQVLVVADPGAGWGFQLVDVSGIDFDSIEGMSRNIDLCDVISSTYTIGDKISEPKDLSGLPDGIAYRDVLSILPVTRATRCFMALNVLWESQRERPNSLATMNAAELASTLCDRYRIGYSTDLYRHDFEDCLEQGSYIDRPNYEGDAYAITPRGVGRLMLLKVIGQNRIGGTDQEDSNLLLFDAVTEQGRRWDDYCFGPAVI